MVKFQMWVPPGTQILDINAIFLLNLISSQLATIFWILTDFNIAFSNIQKSILHIY